MNHYQPGDDIFVGFDDAVAADNALAPPRPVGEFTLPSQSDSSDESDGEEDDRPGEEDDRPVVSLANNLSQFGRGTQPVLTQRSNEAAGALLGLFNQAAAEESTGTVTTPSQIA